jgi:hypothetical protein
LRGEEGEGGEAGRGGRDITDISEGDGEKIGEDGDLGISVGSAGGEVLRREEIGTEGVGAAGQSISTESGDGETFSFEPYGKLESTKITSLDLSTDRFSKSHRRKPLPSER